MARDSFTRLKPLVYYYKATILHRIESQDFKKVS